MFSRCAKTVLSTGSREAGSDAFLECPFELVLEEDPARPRAGRILSVRVLYLGRPLDGVQVVALTSGPTALRLTVRSDTEGRAEFPIDVAGPWLIKAVHMVEAPEDVNADWESFWASLTFEALWPDSA